MTAPISACIIVRDENRDTWRRCLESVRPHVAELIVVDTGSLDGEIWTIAQGYADRIERYTECNDAEGRIVDFAKAREFSFSLATHPWRMWIDADDELVGGEYLANAITEVERVAPPNATITVGYPYEYAYDDQGRCDVRQYRERLIRGKATWRMPVHEVCVPDDAGSACTFVREETVWKHRRQYSPRPCEPNRNLRILRAWADEHGTDDARMCFYLGMACSDAGFTDEAITHLTKYVEISGFDDERVIACLRLCEIYEKRVDWTQALRWAERGIEINETWAEGYFAMARIFCYRAHVGDDRGKQIRDWQRCAHFSRLGLSMPETRTMLFVNPMERQYFVHERLNRALWVIGDVRGAWDSAKQGLSSRPDDKNLAFNLGLYEKHLAREDAMNAASRLRDAGGIDATMFDLVRRAVNEPDALKQQLNGSLSGHVAPPKTRPAPVVEDWPPKVEAAAASAARLDIVFACGDAWEVWNPDTARAGGIGGSETAVIEMSRRLAAKGHRVRVYTSCGEAKTYDGVEYQSSAALAQMTGCDALVAWRYAGHLTLPAKCRVLWVHDVFAYGEKHDIERADRVLALSEWHRQNIIKHHGIAPSLVHVTRNGINLKRFSQRVQRDPFKMVYSSSADRGLEVLLHVWPQIRARVPFATLDVFYGFETWKLIVQQRGDTAGAERIAAIEAKFAELAGEGVTLRGRVDQMTLAREYLSAGVWGYPTWFCETSCIGAQEAQAAGLRIVTSPIAALNETVGDRAWDMVPGDWLSPEYQARFVDSCVDALTAPETGDRKALQAYARKNFSWDGVADDWEAMFRLMIEKRSAASVEVRA